MYWRFSARRRRASLHHLSTPARGYLTFLPVFDLSRLVRVYSLKKKIDALVRTEHNTLGIPITAREVCGRVTVVPGACNYAGVA